MSSVRLAKIKFSNSDKTVYFYKACDEPNTLSKNDVEEVYLSCIAEKLGKPGGQGSAYKAVDDSLPFPIVLKIYNTDIIKNAGPAIGAHLRGLINFRNKSTAKVRAFIDNHTVWPKALIYDYMKGYISGCAMNLIPDYYFSKMTTVYGETKTKESNMDFILQGSEFRRNNELPIISVIGRAKIVYDFVRIVHFIHSNDYVLGDISPRNTLIYIDPRDQKNNRVLLIDTDSFRKKGSAPPYKQAHTTAWIPPECEKAIAKLKSLREIAPNTNPHKLERLKAESFIQNQSTDIWKSCLAVLRLYHYEDNSASIPSSMVAEKNIRKEISVEFLDLIKRGLSESPKERPTAINLLDSLSNALIKKR